MSNVLQKWLNIFWNVQFYLSSHKIYFVRINYISETVKYISEDEKDYSFNFFSNDGNYFCTKTRTPRYYADEICLPGITGY